MTKKPFSEKGEVHNYSYEPHPLRLSCFSGNGQPPKPDPRAPQLLVRRRVSWLVQEPENNPDRPGSESTTRSTNHGERQRTREKERWGRTSLPCSQRCLLLVAEGEAAGTEGRTEEEDNPAEEHIPEVDIPAQGIPAADMRPWDILLADNLSTPI